MKTDVLSFLGAAARSADPGMRDGVPVRIVRASRSYATVRADLWEAITTKERIPRWLMPVEGTLEKGGRYSLVGNASGTILACEPPSRLEVTWEYAGNVSWVKVDLHDEPAGGTRLELQHLVPLDDPKLTEFGPGAMGVGWDLMLFGLEGHVAGGGTPTPEEGMAWMGSEEGRTFVRTSSQAWGVADAAAGTAAGDASALAGKTAAAYGAG
ncbi:MAG: ATPase [Labilithrix sp.]|nr:ATPase [Labilithrix sp.]